ncbi:MAG: cytochrome C oxidase subunit IV family protein [Actinomycetota bacterium]
MMRQEPEKTKPPAPVAEEEGSGVGTPLRAREHTETHHPGPKQYVTIAAILGLITAAEVGVYYVESLRDLLVFLLLGMMVVKFALVVLWFMHVRFDNPGYGRIFATGLALAATVYVIVLLTFGVFS